MQVSVAVPCYNGVKYIEQCLDALLIQSRPADEIIVVDDGSTDGSSAVIQRYPVTLIQHKKNLGLAEARNTAIHVAKGDIIAFVDVDAVADPDWLRILLEGYTHPEIAGVGGAGIEVRIFSPADRWRKRHASQNHGNKPKESVDFLYGLNMSFCRDALNRVGGFCPTLRTNAEDMDMGFRLTQCGYRLVYQPDARVYHQRIDDLVSLQRTIYDWYFWAFLVRRKNRRAPWSLLLGTFRRLLWSDTWPDLFLERDWEMTRINLHMFATKLKAIIAAMKVDEIKEVSVNVKFP
jgi:glycosyltransferase involved in cell wall biosynthesis